LYKSKTHWQFLCRRFSGREHKPHVT
jgi:hypothetical protein